MTNKTKTANNERQPKAVIIRTAEECTKLYKEILESVNLSEWMNTTKNGAYKLTKSVPQVKEDNKGTIKVGNVTYYLVPVGKDKFNVFVSFTSYARYINYRKNLTEKLANFGTFEEWCTKQERTNKFFKYVPEDAKLKEYNEAKAKLGELTDDDEE